jgi:hypothetical protein
MFKNADIVRAVGISAATLSQWCDRGIIELGEGDIASTGTGSPRQFSLKRVVNIALVAELIKIGVNLARAAEAAEMFTDEGSQDRAAGELFARGKTLLVISASTTAVINVRDGRAPPDFGPAVTVDCGEIVAHVDRALGTNRRGRAA